MLIVIVVVVWSAVVGGLTVESLLNTKEDVYHRIWERKIKKSAERTSEFADTSNLLDDIQAYYRIMLSTDFASEESENNAFIDLDAELPSYFTPSNRYWINPAPPFNPKPLHTGEDQGGLQARIPARYMVMFQGRATRDHLTRTVAVMEEVTRTSGRKIRATDFMIYQHVAAGFIATLNNAALDAVSSYISAHYIYNCIVIFSCVFTHWLSLLKKIR